VSEEFVSSQLDKKEEKHDPGEDATDPGTNKQTKVFAAVAALILLAFFAYLLFGFGEEQGPEVLEYNYFEFFEVDGFWQTQIERGGQRYDAAFRFNPEQVENISVEGSFSGFTDETIYITFDPEQEPDNYKYLALATTELSLHVVHALNKTVEAACTKNVTAACENRSIVTCNDQKNVIYLHYADPTKLALAERCITIQGTEFDIVRAVDRLLFQWYKII